MTKRQRIRALAFSLFLSTLAVPAAHAEQPIFDEMPRWTGGWGIQLMQELITRDDENTAAAPGFSHSEESIHLTHIQGVYTWDKAIRVTTKVPVVLFAEKTTSTGTGGETRTVQDRGLGDPTLALPLKYYFNLDGRSGSWTLTPQVRVPAGGKDEYNVYSRNWATGLSGGYASETSLFYLMTGLGAWYEYGEAPLQSDVYVHFGVNYQVGDMNGHIILKQYGKYAEDQRVSYAMGPTIYLRIIDAFHIQLQTRHDLYSWSLNEVNRREHSFRVGAAVVY